MRAWLVVPLAAGAAWAVPAVAAACTPNFNPSFLLVSDPADTTPPGPVEIELGPIRRGEATGSSSLCDDLGRFQLAVTPPAGEDPEEIGYLLAVQSGQAPVGFFLPPGAEQPLDGKLWFDWLDGICLEQEPFDFELRVTPVDRAGNEGPPALVRVSDPGRNPGAGCGGAGGSDGTGGNDGTGGSTGGAGGSGGSGSGSGGDDDTGGAPPDDRQDHVAPPAPGATEPAGGCSATAGSTGLLAGLLVAARLLRRHKRG